MKQSPIKKYTKLFELIVFKQYRHKNHQMSSIQL